MNQPAGSVFLAEWMQLAATLALSPRAGTSLGDELLQRHLEPQRSYHTDRHIVAVIEHLRTLGAATPVALLTAFFHDAIYDPTRIDNEERSALLAVERLRELAVEPIVIDDVAVIVRATAGHQLPAVPPPDAAAFLDADLAILGAPPDVYRAYAIAIGDEYAHMDAAAYRTGRCAVLEHLLGLDPLFHTTSARKRWDAAARRNMRTELTQLKSG